MRCGIMELPRADRVGVAVAVNHPSGKAGVVRAASEAGRKAARAAQTKRHRKHVSDHAAFRFVPFAVKAYGHMGTEAVRFVHRLGASAFPSMHACVGRCSCCRSGCTGGMQRCTAGVG